MRRILRDQGLTLVTLGFFLAFLVGQTLTGYRVYNAERSDWGEPAVSHFAYLRSGHFIEATFENWESEFLQMGAYVLLTAFLVQRGSAESRDPDASKDEDAQPVGPDAPWPVRKGGWALKAYENSLPLALLAIFLFSFVMHAVGGARIYSEEQLAGGGHAYSTWQFMQTSQFWFESFQNWQSEFLAVGALVVLSIFLRQRGSPESKPVEAPHSSTGASQSATQPGDPVAVALSTYRVTPVRRWRSVWSAVAAPRCGAVRTRNAPGDWPDCHCRAALHRGRGGAFLPRRLRCDAIRPVRGFRTRADRRCGMPRWRGDAGFRVLFCEQRGSSSTPSPVVVIAGGAASFEMWQSRVIESVGLEPWGCRV